MNPMERLQMAIQKLMDEWRKENPDADKLDDCEEVVGVFNDGVVSVSKEDETTKINIHLGVPYRIDFDLQGTETP